MVTKPNNNAVELFEISTLFRGDGTLAATYIKLGNQPIAKTDELIQDTVLVDYDAHGSVVGIEILAPVKLEIIVDLVKKAGNPSLEAAIQRNLPHELLVA